MWMIPFFHLIIWTYSCQNSRKTYKPSRKEIPNSFLLKKKDMHNLMFKFYFCMIYAEHSTCMLSCKGRKGYDTIVT